MTYISKKEKVFDLPEQDETSSVSLNQTETKLKRFPSVSDRRAWTSEECQRYQHFYGLVNGSESNISKSASFKYIPFDVLLAILMAEKDAYIQELLDRQEDNRSTCEGKANVVLIYLIQSRAVNIFAGVTPRRRLKSIDAGLYKADGFEDSDDDREALIRKDAEVVALKNKISGLESELEDYRDTLTKAMHKLENLDSIMNENNLLKEKIKYSEETILCLEEKKAELEKELEYYRNNYNTQSDLEAKQKYLEIRKHWEGGDYDEIVRLSSERDILLEQVEKRQRELEKIKAKAAEVEVLRKISETTSSSLEEVSRENECYKKKLESMKCLEKHIEELKKQAQVLTEKYKRESQKANDHLRQINMNNKELQALREERDKLQARVNELMTYESQYISLKSKLHQVELIIDENEILNKKLIQLEQLELENEHLRIRIDQLKKTEIEAAEDKEKIVQLQCLMVDQEEEIRKMMKQIEELSRGYSDKNEVFILRNELEEKNGKLRKYEKQLDDIPVLESEIDELKNKLQKCIDDFKSDKDLLRRLQEELEACRKRCHELEEMAPLCQAELVTNFKVECAETVPFTEELEQTPEQKREFTDKGENTMEILKEDEGCQYVRLEYKDKAIWATDETESRIKEMEEQNQILKGEVDTLRLKLSKVDLDKLIVQTNELKNVLTAKDNKIHELTTEVKFIRKEVESYENLKLNLEEEIGLYKSRNAFMKEELFLQQEDLQHLKDSLTVERKRKDFALSLVKTLEEKLEIEKVKREAETAIIKLQKEEANIAKQEMYGHFSYSIESLNEINKMSKKLIRELKTENRILREIKEYLEDTENKALKDLISRLHAEIAALKSLSKPELEGECITLQQQVKALLTETDALMHEIKEVKAALDLEKTAKDNLEKEVMNLQEELSACVAAGNEAQELEILAKEAVISSLQKELANVKNGLENSVNESHALKDKNKMLEENCSGLESEQKELKNNINALRLRVNELTVELEEREKRYEEEMKEFQMVCSTIKTQEDELVICRESANVMRERIKELEEIAKAKEEELEAVKKASLETKNELNKLHSEMEVLKHRLLEKNTRDNSDSQEQTVKSTTSLSSALMYSFAEYSQKSPATEEATSFADLPNYEKDLEEKYALEETLRNLESELDDLKRKLKECRKMEEEMVNLRSKRDSLLSKMSNFEDEIDSLKSKLCDFENLKNELDQLKAEKKIIREDMEVTKLYQELLEHKSEIASLRKENENLKEELNKSEDLLEIYKNLKKTIPDLQMAATAEFFTPPALPSPHSSGPSGLDSFPDTIPLNVHKKEMTDLENLYEMKIRHLNDFNAEKIKKLIAQHEKEAKDRSKAFYDSINSIKSSYENDIRKLVEKHKVSIMRLQGLHEDEVQELNTNYETQMEAMQTQNENVINDLRTEAAEKYKHLREQHNRDIKDLERKYEDLLREKEAQFLLEKEKVEANLMENVSDIKEGHKQAIEGLTQFYQNSILEMEEKHNHELKNCKKSNLKRIELMKNKYEALLVEERKKYEEQLEEMLLQLKNGQQGDTFISNRDHYLQKKLQTSANPLLEFHEVLQKIINEGLEALTFEEVILVHSKTCFLPRQMGEEDVGGGEVSPRYEDRCGHRELMTAEKEELLKRIFTLEHEIVIKQLETHEAIVNMETAEMCRIQELKNALCSAQQKNLELKRLLSNQSKHEMDLKIDRYLSDRQASLHETSVVEKVKELEKVRAEKKRLEEELQKQKTNVKNLSAAIEAEKERYRTQRKKDVEYVESIRQRLEEALNHEQMMEAQLDYELKFRTRLEAELHSLQKSLNFPPEFPSSPLQIETKVHCTGTDDEKCAKGLEPNEKRSKQNRSKSRHKSKLKAINNS